MRMRWLHQAGFDRAVVVFGGWAVGSAPFETFPRDRDVLFVDDYRDLDCELPEFSQYSSVDLVTWSFGVAAYGHWQQVRDDPFSRKAALCGSLTPVDRMRGIPPRAYKRTVDGLTQAGFQQFLERVFEEVQPKATTDLNALHQELIAVECRGAAPEVGFDRIWLAKRDQIFPIGNLLRAWAGQESKIIETPHAPFDAFASWEDFWR